MMSSFDTNFADLNPAQKLAVNTIDGPVMVVAGPGTGKTQLLSMRVANILRVSDVNPGNILCLTFTESGASAMRSRLIELMGQEAYGVAIHTFHSFGTEIINQYANYFYHGAHFQAADELSSYEILRSIFEKLPHDNPLSVTMNDEFTYLRSAQSAISDLKKSGLTPDELLQILDHNDAYVEFAEPQLQSLFASRLSKKSIPGFSDSAAELSKFDPDSLSIPGYTPLCEVALASFEHAVNEAESTSNTKPLTAWRNGWLEKNDKGDFVFKDRRKGRTLRATAQIYYDYLIAMQERTLYDFDDMILRVVHASEVFSELRYDLQEKYQYILVDEFQDTNGAQLRLLLNLTKSDLIDNSPNIMVVGDDDQAIYSFQGAEIGNILEFHETFPDAKVITLTENYRSDNAILTAARSVIVQGSERLENHLDNINKTLHANHTADEPKAEIAIAPTEQLQYHWLIEDIKKRLDTNQQASSIAILGRNHAHLMAFLPYLHEANIPISYERRDNILDSPPVLFLQSLAQMLVYIASQDFTAVETSMPELLAHPAWGIEPSTLWQISLQAYKERRFWLELMLESNNKLRDIAQWLIVTSQQAQTEPLELMLDILIGNSEPQVAEFEASDPLEPFADGPPEGFTSPLRSFYFGESDLLDAPANYLSYLGALTTLRRHLRDYMPDQPLLLVDFIRFLRLHQATKLGIRNTAQFHEATDSVQLMTTHKSKGLEFDTVYTLSTQDSIWGSSARTRSRLISYPHNLPIAPLGETEDERLRLLYVAMTRAKNQLILSGYERDNGQKDSALAKYIYVPEIPIRAIQPTQTAVSALQQAEITWHERLVRIPKGEMHELLQPSLKRYQLSVTHLNNFIDVTRGGPQAFLLQNLLRFPQSMSKDAVYGSAIHGTLQRAHGHLSATSEQRPVEDVLHDFEQLLANSRLTSQDFEQLLKRGSMALTAYLGIRYNDFRPEQIVEKNFASQGVVIGDASVSGAIDLLEVNDIAKEIVVTDYKTGKASRSWQGKTDFEKIKLHKYRQQLMFYKLLIEKSRDYGGKYTVDSAILEFVEPTKSGDIERLEILFDTDELQRFEKLVQAIWQRIIQLDLPDISKYELSYKGILAFEQDLLDHYSMSQAERLPSNIDAH